MKRRKTNLIRGMANRSWVVSSFCLILCYDLMLYDVNALLSHYKYSPWSSLIQRNSVLGSRNPVKSALTLRSCRSTYCNSPCVTPIPFCRFKRINLWSTHLSSLWIPLTHKFRNRSPPQIPMFLKIYIGFFRYLRWWKGGRGCSANCLSCFLLCLEFSLVGCWEGWWAWTGERRSGGVCSD
jgi:hypothetical protein